MQYDAVVYDLDGTLVDLAVDWAAVRRDVAATLTDLGADPGERDLWGLLGYSADCGHRGAVEAVIADHECEGAHASARLPLADEVGHPVPVGVCSLNCEAACHIALDTHDIADAVDAVVGRDSVEREKPDPEPLLHTLSGLGVAPADAVFVGDSERDRECAERAGVAFEWA